MYPHHNENNLVSLNQWGFKQGDSCQLLSITHEIYNSFDEGCILRHFKDI